MYSGIFLRLFLLGCFAIITSDPPLLVPPGGDPPAKAACTETWWELRGRPQQHLEKKKRKVQM